MITAHATHEELRAAIHQIRRRRKPAPRLAPLEIVGATEHQQKAPSAIRAECPLCDKPVVGGAIVTDSPAWSMAHKCHVRFRTFYCDSCNHLVQWLQATDAAGTVEGPVILGPGLVRDGGRCRPVEKFLHEHPEAAGVAHV